MQYPDYPFTSHYITVNNLRLHYLDEGDKTAPPVVMLHGNPTWSFFFRRLIPAVCDKRRCIVPDHIGMGLSDKPPDTDYDYTLDRRIDDLEALLAKLEIDSDITLILHDWGGMIGMGYACRHPQRICSLIIMNTAAFHLPGGMQLPWQLRLARGPLGPVLVRGFNLFCRGAVRHCVVRAPMTPEVAGAYLAPYASWSQRLAVLRFIQDIPLHAGEQSYDVVTAIDSSISQFRSVPMLLCWGMRDFVFNTQILDEWQRRFPRAEVHRFDNAGHYLLEDAVEEVLPVIHRFLASRVPAISMSHTNIAARLIQHAAAHPDQQAVVIADGKDLTRQYTYTQLDEISTAMARGLRRAGLGKGDRVVLMVPPGLEFFALAYALFKLGAVLVGVDPGLGIRNLGPCLAEAEPAAFIGNRKAHLARWLLRWAARSIRINITTEKIPLLWNIIGLSRVLESGQSAQEPLAAAVDGVATAAILFTSGSTGAPKGAVYTHANFNAQITALQQTFDIRQGEIDLATFPLFALFGPALGMTTIIPAMDFTRPGSVDAATLIHTIEQYGPTTMFGSPALLRRVGEWGAANGVTLPTLKRVLSAGAPVAPVVLEQFSRLLAPGTKIHTPYGATEALPVSSIDSDEVINQTRALTEQGKGICVGKAVAGIEINIIKITDDAISAWNDDLVLGPNEIGEIVVRGPQVTRNYYHREEATILAKITGPGASFYHRMGDLGYLDGAGRLWFCGRKSQRVVTPAGTLYTIPCEAVFNTHPKIFRSALVGVINNQVVAPVLCVETASRVRPSEYDQIKSELLEIGGRHEHTAIIRDVLFHTGFPVDIRHNAKINREQLAEWAQRRLR